jgi:tetratricopeptide (TPR) repeat protein
MTRKNTLIELIRKAGEEEQALFANLPEGERSRPGRIDGWSAKDALVHLACWKERVLENAARLSRGEPLVTYDDYLKINDDEFGHYRGWSWDQVSEKTAAANRQILEMLAGKSEAELDQPWQQERKFWQAVLGTAYIHSIMHLAQIYIEAGNPDYATALQLYTVEKLGQLDNSPAWQGTIKYNLACHYALIGEREKAIAGLREAIELEPSLIEWSKQDTDLDSIREDPAYKAIYAE